MPMDVPQDRPKEQMTQEAMAQTIIDDHDLLSNVQMHEAACGRCLYWWARSSQIAGHCRRHAPPSHSPDAVTYPHATGHDYWCGEFVRIVEAK